MTKIPPYFVTQMEEQKKWDDGFKAGISEVLHSLTELSSSDDLEGPTKEWIEDFNKKILNKYI